MHACIWVWTYMHMVGMHRHRHKHMVAWVYGVRFIRDIKFIWSGAMGQGGTGPS